MAFFLCCKSDDCCLRQVQALHAKLDYNEVTHEAHLFHDVNHELFSDMSKTAAWTSALSDSARCAA